MADIFPYISYHDTSEKHMENVILFVTQFAVLADTMHFIYYLNTYTILK